MDHVLEKVELGTNLGDVCMVSSKMLGTPPPFSPDQLLTSLLEALFQTITQRLLNTSIQVFLTTAVYQVLKCTCDYPMNKK